MNCNPEENITDLGYFDINDFCNEIFKNDYQDPKSIFFTINENTLHSTLVFILVKGVKILFNLTDINNLSLDNFELLQHYFNSFGFKIIYEPVLKNTGELDAYNVGFIPLI